MKYRQFNTLLITLASILAGCTLDTINNYGNDCTNWAYIRNGSSISCDSKTLEDCNEAFQAAYKAGKCPEHYGMCTFDNDGNKFCMASCSSASAPNLCNGECLTDKAYELALKEPDETGEAENCKPCPEKCLESCDPETRECPKIECPDECANDCDEAGKCKGCINGWNENGTCACPSQCVNGCNDDGSCKCPDECTNNCDETGKCKGCINGWDKNGTCICPENCQKNGCDDYGKCLCPECMNGSICNPTKGVCSCIEDCLTCDEHGFCDDACKNFECSGPNDRCELVDGNPKCVNTCATLEESCQAKGEFCKMGECLPIDANHNHMHDQYEKAVYQGKSCRKHSDCNSAGHDDGFCDSFIGYKCSTRCTSADQCVEHTKTEDEPFDKYVCRSDGRCVPDSFITVWEIPENYTLTIPTYSGNCEFDIDWGDNTDIEHITDCKKATHKYTTAGTYTVSIKGKLHGYGYSYFPSQPDLTSMKTKNQKLSKIITFGQTEFSGNYIFAYTNNIQFSQTDIPNASNLKFNHMFIDATSFNQPLNNWDTSNVTSMSYMFQNASAFNQPLDNWDTSNVTSMSYMFSDATTFNQPLENWNTSSVISMSYMFQNASAFNQSLNNWDFSNVTSMNSMFADASAYNQPINWNLPALTSASYMFKGASSFNSPIMLNAPNLTSFYQFFDSAIAFNDPSINNWDTSKITNMSYMFNGAAAFNQPLDKWDTSNVTNMDHIFNDATAFNQPLNKWNTSAVTAMRYMFNGATAFNQPLNKWDTSKVTNFTAMFQNAQSFNQDLSSWHVKTNVGSMFDGSGLSQENYCKIQASESWTKKPTMKQYTCGE